MIQEAIRLIEHALNGSVTGIQALSTGIDQACYKIDLKSDSFFLKLNSSSSHLELIAAELEANECFKKHSVRAPQLILHDHQKKFSFLLTEYMQVAGKWTDQSIKDFAENLVRLHSVTKEDFGWGRNNYIGSLEQDNRWYRNFSEYFWESRLLPQLKLAVNARLLENVEQFVFIKELLNQFPITKASLIHGDLWSGNHLEDSFGNSYLIDASIQFGCREMDLAMMLLFGGFPKEVFEIYLNVLPLEKTWEKRIDVFQLYYLLVHLNIFGITYLDQVNRCVSRIKDNFLQ